MVEKRYWVEIVFGLLSSYPNGGVFASCEKYLGDPFESEALNARIDLWRALKRGHSDAEEIVDFLNMVEEGWFYEEKARLRQEVAYFLGEKTEKRGLVS